MEFYSYCLLYVHQAHCEYTECVSSCLSPARIRFAVSPSLLRLFLFEAVYDPWPVWIRSLSAIIATGISLKSPSTLICH